MDLIIPLTFAADLEPKEECEQLSIWLREHAAAYCLLKENIFNETVLTIKSTVWLKTSNDICLHSLPLVYQERLQEQTGNDGDFGLLLTVTIHEQQQLLSPICVHTGCV